MESNFICKNMYSIETISHHLNTEVEVDTEFRCSSSDLPIPVTKSIKYFLSH